MEFHDIINYIKDTIINIFLKFLSFVYILFGIKKDDINKILEMPNCVFAHTYLRWEHAYQEKLKPKLPGFTVLFLDTLIHINYVLSRPLVLLLNNYYGYNVETEYIEKCTRNNLKKPLDKRKMAISSIKPNFKPLDTSFKYDKINNVNNLKVKPNKITKDNIMSVPVDILKMSSKAVAAAAKREAERKAERARKEGKAPATSNGAKKL